MKSSIKKSLNIKYLLVALALACGFALYYSSKYDKCKILLDD